MKLTIIGKDQNKKGEKQLPSQFNEEYRPDLIRRAVHALQSLRMHRYGSALLAGMRSSSRVSKRRRNWRGCYGFGISRVNRKVLSRRGTRMFWVGAFTPQTTGGRRAHPPKVEKQLDKKINIKERRKAIRSAISATIVKSLVQERGHHVPENYPFIISSDVETLEKTKDIKDTLSKLGFSEELDRSLVKSVRAGIGKRRGRRYKKKKGILVVVGDKCPLLKSAQNISGIDIVEARSLNVELLAPGAMAGRVTLWTEKAIDALEKEKLFQ